MEEDAETRSEKLKTLRRCVAEGWLEGPGKETALVLDEIVRGRRRVATELGVVRAACSKGGRALPMAPRQPIAHIAFEGRRSIRDLLADLSLARRTP